MIRPRRLYAPPEQGCRAMMIPAPSQSAPEQAPRPTVAWEEPDCPLCGGRDWAPLIEAPDPSDSGGGLWFAVVRCRACQLCFTNPRPDPATIGHFYAADYRPHRRPKFRRNARRWYPLAVIGGRTCVERRALPRHGNGRLLDFGCGGGSFLERMHHQGWSVVGLDTSDAAVRSIRDELGLTAHVGSLPHPELEPASFDVITMWHALEHV